MSDFTPGQRVIFTEGDGVPQFGTFYKYHTIAGKRDYAYIKPDKVRIANEIRSIHLHWVKSA
jgi:hypothetical protein